MKTKKTLEFLQSGEKSSIRSLFDKVKKIADLDQALKAELAPPLRDHCRVANIRSGKLVIQADSPVWGSKLRFELTSLLASLRKQPQFAGLAGIDFFVAPISVDVKMEKPSSEKKYAPISASHRQLLLDTANKTSDPKLKAVLAAIAARK